MEAVTIEDPREGIEPVITRQEQMERIVTLMLAGDMKLSYTALSNFMDSPKDFADYKLQKKEPTAAMKYGSVLHCLVLEPSAFESRYFALDDTEAIAKIGGAKPRATKAYKEWKAEECMKANGREIVSPLDAMRAQIVAECIRRNRASRKILDLCPRKEIPIQWSYMNFEFHGFVDGDGDDDIFDLKTMPDAQQDKVQREIAARKLYVQAVMYLTGLKQQYEREGKQWRDKRVHIIAADGIAGISVHELNHRYIEHGMEQYAYYMTRFNHAILTDAWDQSYDFYSDRWDGIFQCDKPGWLH